MTRQEYGFDEPDSLMIWRFKLDGQWFAVVCPNGTDLDGLLAYLDKKVQEFDGMGGWALEKLKATYMNVYDATEWLENRKKNLDSR